MKLMIVYASAGKGHFKAAKAIYNYLHRKDPTLHLELVDILEKSNCLFRYFYTLGYSFLVRQAAFLWRVLFYVSAFRPLRSVLEGLGFALANDFKRFLIEYSPDYVISTHFFPAQVAAYLKLKGKIKTGIISVLTDFGVHPFWVCPGIDLYSVATEISQERLLAQGISKEKIKVLGIPVDEKFFLPLAKSALCQKLGIKEGHFVVLVATGSFGIGPIEEIIEVLYKDVELLVVCANNQKLYQKLKKKNYHSSHIYAFVDNMEELMSVADIIITKPGGLTIAELLCKELVPIFISPIPGQETENIRILRDYGIGCLAKDVAEIKSLVFYYKNNPHILSKAKENIRRIKKISFGEELYRVIRQGSFCISG